MLILKEILNFAFEPITKLITDLHLWLDVFFCRYWHPKPEDDFFTELRYLRGFLQIQDILDRSIISLQTGAEVDSPIYMQQFPATCYRKDT